MKKLSLISIVFLSSLLNAQVVEGINQEHLVSWTDTGSFLEEKFKVQRIALKTGVELEYVEQGDQHGVAVIFLHGITDSWHSFETTLPHLPSNIHAFAVSQRGHGNSERPPGNYRPKDFAADVAAFVEQKNTGPVVIAGHSMGGVNAQRFAIDFPHLTKALVIIDSDPAFINNPGMSEFYEMVMKLESPLSRAFMTEFQKSTLAKPIDSAYFNLVVSEGLKVPVPVFQAACRDMLEVISVAELQRIDKPTAIFWGDKDALCFCKGQEELKKNIRDSRLIIYGNTGHALHWEEPARFAKDLAQFIQSIGDVK